MSFLDYFKKEQSDPNYEPFEVAKPIEGKYEDFELKLRKHSLIVLIIGKRGSGKTSLGMKLLEMFHKKTKKKCFVMVIKGRQTLH